MRKTLRSFFAKALFVLAFVMFTPTAFAQIFQFNFENTTAVTTDNAVGTPTFTSNGLASTGYSTVTPCQGSRLYTAANWDSGDYYQFTVNTTGYGNMTLSFCDRTDNTSVGTFIVRVSSDGGGNWTTVLNTYTPATSNTSARTTGTFPASANNQDEVLIQIYKTSSPNNLRTYLIDNVTLNGSAIPTVTSFTPVTNCTGSSFNITGTNFTGATSVQINNVNVAFYTVNSATSITAVIASGNTSGAVKVSNANGSGTSASNITINPSPTGVSATASSTAICAGSSLTLNAAATPNSAAPVTVLSENFNGALNSWTKINNSTGGTPAGAAWTLRPNGYSYATSSTVTFNSNDNSQFYLSNSDAPGNGSTTATILQSPSFSTVGMTSANLTFYHYYRYYNGGESGKVEISTNGASWTTLDTYSANTGTSNNFAQETISLASYLNQATVFIRFKYDATFDYYWAVDNVTVSGISATSATYAWTSTPAGFTSAVQNPSVTPSANTTYHVAVTNSYGCTVSASTDLVVVDPVTVPGTVTGSATVCSGSNSGALTLGTHTGTVIRWESSLDNFATAPTTIASATATLNYTNLTATTSYRAVVKSGSCASANSAAATITVNPATVAGTVTNSATVCSGSNGGTLTLGGYTGNVIRWESSLDNFATAPTTIVNTTPSLNYSNLTATTSYRAVVQSGVCAPANSVAATITVNPATVAGTVTNSTTVCSGSNGGTLTLGGYTGNVIRWESSLDNFATAPTAIVNTTPSLNYSNLTATTSYRAVVQSGVCAPANAVAATITVSPASVGGTISGSTTVCANSNSGSLTLSGYTGSITRWQSCDLADFSVGVLDIPNSSTTLSYLNLAGTTYYRAVLTSGVCAPAFSSVAAIIVAPAAVGGTISGSATVCYGNNSGTLTLSGYSGTITGWESSVDNFATAGTPVANTTTTLNYSNLTGTTAYRALISNGVCPAVYSSVATITANVNSVWLGTNSSSWNDAGNWSCGIVPTTDVHVTITSVTNQPVVSSDAFAHTLTMETGTTLTVQSGSSLTIEGAINGQGTSLLTVENDANLIQVDDVSNTGNAVVKRNTNPLKRLDYTLWSSPVSGQNLLAFSPATVTNRFYIYNPSTDLYNTVVPSTTSFAEGTGYLIRTPNNFPTTATVWNGTFAGTLNNGDVNLAVANNSYNAIGNPYPSAIDADAFIAGNGLTEALYFWRKTNNDLTTSYATYTLAGGAGTGSNTGGDPGLLVPDGIIMPGQGFIAKSTSTTLSFNNGMRSGNNGQFFRNASIERNRIWLNLTGSEGVFSQTMVSYMTGATQGVDAAIDGLYFNDSQVALTSLIGTSEFAVQGRALPFASSDVVPLGFKAISAGTYTIGLDHTDGLFADVSQPILLKDNTDGSIHDLRTGNYTFAAEAGVSNSRFELVYQTTLQTNIAQWNPDNVIVYTRNGELFVHTGKVMMDSVQVYDVRGRLLASKDKINSGEVKLMPGAANQVLIVKITSDQQNVVTKKVAN